tara:strand:+ start:113 stop:424 length:312 start_codon:yes stop_codon:yes gene_type:complete
MMDVILVMFVMERFKCVQCDIVSAMENPIAEHIIMEMKNIMNEGDNVLMGKIMTMMVKPIVKIAIAVSMGDVDIVEVRRPVDYVLMEEIMTTMERLIVKTLTV